MVTVAIISLLAAMAVPALIAVKRRSVATAVVNDLRVFAAAFETYAQETGSWPAEVEAGALPPEMAARIKSTAWERQTPLGGRYNWDKDQLHQGTTYRAVIAINSTAASPLVTDLDLFEAVDQVMDDGNLTSGNIRIGADDEPIFIVAP